jgi:hypothetical protein
MAIGIVDVDRNHRTVAVEAEARKSYELRVNIRDDGMHATIAAVEPPARIGSARKGSNAEIAKGAIFDFRRNLDAGIVAAILIDDVGGIVPRQTVAPLSEHRARCRSATL